MAPRRPQAIGRLRRWPGNLGVVVVDTLLVRAHLSHGGRRRGVGGRGARLGAAATRSTSPSWLAIIIAVIVLDLAIYLQHVLFHAVPVLWRLHRMHHADLEIDVTTGAPLPSHRDPAVDGDQAWRRGGTRRTGGGRADLRGAAQRHLDVQPRQRPPARSVSTGCCAGWSSRPTCTACTIRSCRARPTAISASICPGGTACSAPTGRSPQAGHEGMTIGIEQFRDPARAAPRPHAVAALSR